MQNRNGATFRYEAEWSGSYGKGVAIQFRSMTLENQDGLLQKWWTDGGQKDGINKKINHFWLTH